MTRPLRIEGRFKSCLVDSENYLFTLYRYIEMNPVRAGMVSSISEYPWSSYGYNGLGEENSLITEHKLYQDLGEDLGLRAKNYQKTFETLIGTQQEQEMTVATMRGEVYGSEGFHLEINKMISRTTKLTAHGGDRDRKSEKYRNQAG